jgi:hypothetical protein
MTTDPIADITIAAAAALAAGEIEVAQYKRAMALASLLADGIRKPSSYLIEWRIAEMENAGAFSSVTE